MVLYAPYLMGDTIYDGLKHAKRFFTKKQFIRYLQKHNGKNIKIEIEPDGYDERINWHTQTVCVDGSCHGYLNKPFPPTNLIKLIRYLIIRARFLKAVKLEEQRGLIELETLYNNANNEIVKINDSTIIDITDKSGLISLIEEKTEKCASQITELTKNNIQDIIKIIPNSDSYFNYSRV